MKNLLKEWKIYLKEAEDGSERFKKNVEIIRNAYKNSYTKLFLTLIDDFTPENSKILTEIDLEDDQKKVMGGVYGKVFPIKDSDRMLKLFTQGVDVEKDVRRMKRIVDQVFKGEASLNEMHYFEFGTLGVTPEGVNEANTERQTLLEPGYQAPTYQKYFKYVIMPKIIPFEKSYAFKEDPNLFNIISPAIQEAARKAHRDITFTDFFELVMKHLYTNIESHLFYIANKKREIDSIGERLTNLQDTFSKLIHVAYNTFKKEGGTDLHLGNLGYFPQKPDDLFYFDM